MITVVEPHPDDAFVSLGSTIERWIGEGRDVRIVTVFASPGRAAESAAYARAIGASHVALGVRPAGSALTTGAIPVDLPASVLGDLLAEPGGRWVWPVGIQHPEHASVADLGWRVDPGAWGYLDLPYALKTGQAEEVHRLTYCREIVSWVPTGRRKWRYESLYASQSLFFHRNRDLLARAPEVVVGRSIESRHQRGVG